MCGDFWCFPPHSGFETLHSLACVHLPSSLPMSCWISELQPCCSAFSLFKEPYSLPAQDLVYILACGWNILHLAVGPLFWSLEAQKIKSSTFLFQRAAHRGVR